MARPRKYDPEKIQRLYEMGHSYGYISSQLGCSVQTIERALADYDDGVSDEEIDTSGERCSCGLRLPCNSCLHGRELLGPGFLYPASNEDL